MTLCVVHGVASWTRREPNWAERVDWDRDWEQHSLSMADGCQLPEGRERRCFLYLLFIKSQVVLFYLSQLDGFNRFLRKLTYPSGGSVGRILHIPAASPYVYTSSPPQREGWGYGSPHKAMAVMIERRPPQTVPAERCIDRLISSER